MASASTTSLVDTLRQLRLLETAQLDEVKSFQHCFADPKALATELLQRGWLTPYQVNQLLQGQGQELLLGSYILLERVGEGGMGQVFKARNWKLGRTVAVKLIRKERLDNPDAIRRFQREVRSAAVLCHPNIVHADDADQIGGTHLLVMEYAEGTDLAKLVKKNGPLPVPQACEYIRQAALGLQHAYECGMVHRDIKPHNLLLTDNGSVVKILDMGLARLDHPGTEDAQSSLLTHEGMVMGTPDYIAPEQALQSHTVDIRADIYSLGCTFYFLLTRCVPFPGGSLTEKLLKHQLDDPTPVELLRPEVPPGVAALVRKMMAKKPADRYPTPAEVALALTSVFGTGRGAFPTATAGGRMVARAETAEHTLDAALDYMAQGGKAAAVSSPRRLARKAQERRWLLSLVAGVTFVLLGLAVVLVLALQEPARKKSPADKEGQADKSVPPGQARVDQAWLKLVAAMPAEEQVKAVAVMLQEISSAFDGKVTARIEDGVVTELGLVADNVTDLSPVRALRGLQTLDCRGSYGGRVLLANLSPLKGMKLTRLVCSYTQVTDLSPLQDMPLISLSCSGTPVTNLSPLKDLPLTSLSCGGTQVTDLSPLKDLPLTYLECYNTPVTDLSPLKDLKLTSLQCGGTRVTDLSPLKNMPLTSLSCGGTRVTDLSPLKNLKLTALDCGRLSVTDLSPLKDMRLTSLSCKGTKVADLSPLKDMPLSTLDCGGTPVTDLSPLKDLPLTTLYCKDTKAPDLSPLKEMPLKDLHCDFIIERDAEMLRVLSTLEKINDKPVKEFWKEVDETKLKKKP